MREVRWERMFPDQLEAAFAECPVVYFTYGLCEPHGPQNTVGLDALKAHAIAVRAAREHGGIVAPAHYWHVHEVARYASWAYENIGEVRPWMTSVPPWVHFYEVCYHVRTADVLGFHAAIFITGHYGANWEDLKWLIEAMQPLTPMRMYALPDFEANTPGFDGDGRSGDHAGKVETSLLWSLEPSCVDVSRMPATPEQGAPPNFAMGRDAYLADRQIGDRMVNDEVRWLGKKARELLDAYVAVPDHKPLTFADVEKFWAETVKPRMREFASNQYDRPEPPPGSRWRANWSLPEGI